MKALSSKWKWVLTTLSLAFILFLTWNLILSKSIELYLQYAFPTFTGKILEINGLHREKEYWVIDHPRVYDPQHTEDALLEAKRAIFNYNLNFFKGELDLHITLDQPELRIQHPNSHFSSGLTNLETPIFKVKSRLTLNQGQLILGEHKYALEGELKLSPSFEGNILIDFAKESSDSNHLLLHLIQNPHSEWQMDFQCQNLDCFHLHHAISYLCPLLQNFKIQQGILDGSGGMILKPQSRPHFYGEINLTGLFFEHLPTNLKGTLKKVECHLKKNSEKLLSMGSITFPEEISFSYGSQSEFSNIKGGIYIDDQAQAKIAFQGNSLSLDGLASIPSKGDISLNLNWQFSDPQESHMQGSFYTKSLEKDGISFNAHGNIHSILQNISNDSLQRNLDKHEFTMTANLKHCDAGGELSGLIKINDRSKKNSHEIPISFGFELEKSENFDLKNGWFHAIDIPIKKYLSSYLELPMEITGFGNIHGYFNPQTLIMTYETYQMCFENYAFAIDAAEISQDSHTLPVHILNLKNGTYFGSFSLINASYFEKNSELLFTDINADIAFDKNHISIPKLESFCQGVYLESSIDIDTSHLLEGHFEVDILPQTVHGKVTQLQSILSHFPKPAFFLKAPVEGDITMHHHAGHLHFAFSPNNYDLDAHLKGAVSDGMLISNTSNMTLQEISFNFEYDYRDNSLDFSEIQATLLIGEPERVEEYTVIGEKIHFSDYVQNRASFDLWVGDRKRDVIRVVGETQSIGSESDKDYIKFIFDQNLTHFGNVHPQTFHLVLKDWWQVQEFHMIADFKLKSLFQDLKRFCRTGFLFLSRHFLKQLNDIENAEGIFKIEVEYDKTRSQLDYAIIGKNVVIDSHEFKNILLKGKKSDKSWIIEQLTLDNISIAANILYKPQSWFIDFLGIQLGNSVLIGLQGEYFDHNRTIDGKINLLEINVDALKEWDRTSFFLEKYPLKGDFRATGSFHCECSPYKSRSNKLDISLDASLKDWEFEGLPFQDINHLSLNYNSDRGLSVGPIKTSLKHEKQTQSSNSLDDSVSSFSLEKMEYNINQNIFSLENLDFIIPSKNIAGIIENITPFLKGISYPNNLEGRLSLDYAKPHYAIKLALKDGEYQFLNKKLALSDIVLEYDPCEIQILAKCHNDTTPFWIQCKSSSTQNGELIIAEDASFCQPLVIKWENTPEGFIIHQIAGEFRGMNFALAADQSSHLTSNPRVLEGDIKINGNQVLRLISKDLRLSQDSKKRWKVFLSNVEVKEFKPCLLKKPDNQQAHNFPDFTIRELLLDDLQGFLGDSNSFIGKGSLVFVNSSQTLLSIPSDILTHLGLNPSVLNPVIGTLFYEIRDSKILLTKLKDSYSQGKLSKFNLNNSSQSYIDFDGNLNIQIKMKQNNLFFKLAELFTVTVKGTLQKPTYTLQKQKKI